MNQEVLAYLRAFVIIVLMPGAPYYTSNLLVSGTQAVRKRHSRMTVLFAVSAKRQTLSKTKRGTTLVHRCSGERCIAEETIKHCTGTTYYPKRPPRDTKDGPSHGCFPT
jgi:hypothetical protein